MRADRRAIVTGGAGFIGSHTVDALLADGWEVVVIDDLSTGDAHNVADQASLEVVDISDRKAIDRVIDITKPSAIFHLAAQSSVTRSVADPERDCEVNVHGTLNVLDAATRHDASVVFTSTGGALYGNRAPIPTPEEASPRPISPYGASKWAGEAYIVTWREATGLLHSVCRLGNVYGPRQSPLGEAGVVAIFAHHLWSGKTPKIYGFGKPTRDYVHVHDVARALLAAFDKGGTFNISTGVETDVMQIFDGVQEAAGTSLQPQLVALRPGELERSCMDPTCAREQLGWRAGIGLREGLKNSYRALVEEFESETASDARGACSPHGRARAPSTREERG
jgi:UDP-glucose 4-epimerase